MFILLLIWIIVVWLRLFKAKLCNTIFYFNCLLFCIRPLNQLKMESKIDHNWNHFSVVLNFITASNEETGLKFNFLKFDLCLWKNEKSNLIFVLLNVGETTDVIYGKNYYLYPSSKRFKRFQKSMLHKAKLQIQKYSKEEKHLTA